MAPDDECPCVSSIEGCSETPTVLSPFTMLSTMVVTYRIFAAGLSECWVRPPGVPKRRQVPLENAGYHPSTL